MAVLPTFLRLRHLDVTAAAWYEGRMASKLIPPASGWPIDAVAERLGVALDAGVASRLGAWLDRLVTWNARVDLTAARSADELTDLMLADAMVLASRVPRSVRVVDVGTGAGAPGLALAILRPDLDVTLVEPLAKRAAFLRTVHGALGFDRLTLDPRKGEQAADAKPGGWDVAIARATLAPAAWLDLARRLVHPRGSAWVFLAREPNPTDDAFRLAEEAAYTWPLTGAARRLVRYERVGALPPG